MEFGTMMLALCAGLGCYLVYVVAFKCWVQVPEGHVAVLTTFGKADFANEKARVVNHLHPGVHFKRPWQDAHIVRSMEQMIELAGEEGGTTAMAADGTVLRLDAKLRFTPMTKELYSFLFAMERPTEHVKGLFTCLLRNEIANFVHADEATIGDAQLAVVTPLRPEFQTGSYAAIRRERRRLNQHIQDFCRREIAGKYGVRFEGVDITDILPPDELAQALNGVINAQSEADRVYAETQALCEQRIMAAERGLDIGKAKGKATETEILTMTHVLGNLQRNGTLHQYVARRRSEVFSEAKAAYIRRAT